MTQPRSEYDVGAATTEGRIAALEAQVRSQQEIIQRLLNQGGLRRLLSIDISRHAVQDLTAVPTETVQAGSLRTVTDGGLYYIFARIGSGWRGVNLPL